MSTIALLIDKDCRKNVNDRNYYGTQNVTISGQLCRKWRLTSNHPGIGNPPQFQSGMSNYCRTPQVDNKNTPWCYIDSIEKRWENCNVPLCGKYFNRYVVKLNL